MKILRKGAKRYVKETTLFDRKPDIVAVRNKVELRVNKVPDVSSESTFDYTIELTYDEIITILNRLDIASGASDDISTAFSDSTKTLFRLTMLSSGLRKS